MKKVALTNFVRGGKSSICRLVGMNNNTTVLNFDSYRNAEHYNEGIVRTHNIPEHSIVKYNPDSICINDNINIKGDCILLDFGGRFDERISETNVDTFVIPFFNDYESIAESVKATNYILKHYPNVEVIHVLNQGMCDNKKEKQEFLNDYLDIMKTNEINVPYLEMPKSKLLKRIVNEGTTKDKIIGDSKFLENNYKKISVFTQKLNDMIKDS